MRNLLAVISISLLLSCQSVPGPRHLKQGDSVSLNKVITFPESSSHIILQAGKVIKGKDLMAYQTNCVVDNFELGPKDIKPQNYQVRNVTYNEEMYFDAAAIIRYYSEFYLSSHGGRQQDLIITCQTLDDTMQHHSFPVDEIALATGDYFSF
ncbi:MAG: hypothetical protein KJN89_06660 [Gammaproteobacteria bacterium]|nr:hypothetical protein [Gammaproteobacteria bacterium]MBT8133029.1 hypothetical protein [Gammaproteobacteria bacterium]NNJ50039.1 hypothetical protein [Gammaproteobacteria bacterium]